MRSLTGFIKNGNQLVSVNNIIELGDKYNDFLNDDLELFTNNLCNIIPLEDFIILYVFKLDYDAHVMIGTRHALRLAEDSVQLLRESISEGGYLIQTKTKDQTLLLKTIL